MPSETAGLKIGLAALSVVLLTYIGYQTLKDHTRAKEQTREECVKAGIEFYFQRDFPDHAEAIGLYEKGEKGVRNADGYLWDAYLYPDSVLNSFVSPEIEHAGRLGKVAKAWTEAQCSYR